MKKIRNDRSTYLTRASLLAKADRKEKPAPVDRTDRGDFKVDSAGYFIWPKKPRLAAR